MTAGTRYRLVIEQGGNQAVSTVPYGPGEIGEQIELEARLHEAFGWTVERQGEGASMVLACSGKKGKRRTVSAEAYEPMEDV